MAIISESGSSLCAKLVLREDLMKDSIHVHPLSVDGSWLQISDISGRINCATDLVDLSPYLQNACNPLVIRLHFTATHRIDYVGLDTTPEVDSKITQALLVSAVHSAYGNVWLQLLLGDGTYTELMPNQQITLTFMLPTVNAGQVRTFTFCVEGHYYTIQP